MSAGEEPSSARCDTGTSGLNHILGGGFPPNALYLVQGEPGVGKTTLALQFLMAGARAGESCLYVTFSETSAELFAVAQSHGWSLDGIDILEVSDFAQQLTADAESTLLAKATAFGIDLGPFIREGVLHAQQVDSAKLSPGQFAHLLVDFVERQNVRMVIIDSLNGYSKAMQEGEILDLQLHDLLTYLGQLGVVTIMVLAQSGFLNEFRSPVDLTYLADTVINLRHFEARGAIRQAISVAKKRSGGHESTIREFKVSAKGLWVGEPLLRFRGVLTGVPVLESEPGVPEKQETDGSDN